MSSVDELLYLETDGGCACCGLRDIRVLTVHHIEEAKPKNESYDNKIVLCHNCHDSHHNGKGLTKKEIQTVKRRLIIKTLTRPGLNAMKHALRKGQVIATPFLVNHLVEQQFLEYKDVVTSFAPVDSWLDDVEIAAIYELTKTGKQLMERWSLNAA